LREERKTWPRGVGLLAISHDRPEDLRVLARELELHYPLVSDAGYRLIDACAGREANRVYARPALVVVGPDGRVAWAHIGVDAADRADPSVVRKVLAAYMPK